MTQLAADPRAPLAAGDAVVVASNVHKAFHVSRPPRQVLRGVSLTVRNGEFLAIMGASGSGKSTLLHILGGLEPPDQGTVFVQGTDMYAMSDGARSAFRRDHIGFVFQFFNLLPSLTAAENVALPLRLRNESWLRPGKRRVPQSAVTERVFALMSQLNLHGLQGHGPDQISGGEQQRVAIARALAAAPSLLLADEPTGNLDWNAGHDVLGLLTGLCHHEQQTIVLVTHDARVAAYADRVLVIRDGLFVDEVLLETRKATNGSRPDPAPLVARLSKLDL